MEGPVVHSIVKPDGTRRVDFFRRRRDGTFGFEEAKWDAEEQCWIPIGPSSDSFSDTFDRARCEATSRVSWLAGD